MILILGRESNVRGVPFMNGQMIIEILHKSNGFSNVQVLERKFINKFGISIKEDIIIAEKGEQPLSKDLYGRAVAVKHLEAGLKNVNEDVFKDIMDAIQSSQQINESPILNLNDILHD